MRKLKRLGVAIVLAICCASIFQVASATAGFYAPVYPAEINGVDSDATSEFVLTTGRVTCEDHSGGGQVVKAATETYTATGLSEAKCSLETVLGPVGGTLKPGGCGYSLHPTSELSSNTYSGTLKLGPEGCGPMVLSFPSLACQFSFSPQTAGGSVTFENVGSGETANVKAKTKSLTLSSVKSGSGCKPEETIELSYGNEWTIRAFEGSIYGPQIALHATSEPPPPSIGIFLEGSKLTAESYPVTFKGAATKVTNVLSTESGTIECTEASYEGSAAAAVSEVKLTPHYAGCRYQTIYGEIEATVKVNGCEYISTISGTTGKVSLSCPAEKSLVFSAPGCNTTVSPQQLGTVTYENTGSGAYRGVKFTDSGSAVKYSIKGVTCGTYSAEKGVFAGTATLYGS